MTPSTPMRKEGLTLILQRTISADAKTWYERLNLFGKLKRFCQYCTGTFFFWLLVAACTLIEPILCSNKPIRNIWWAQVYVLAISSGLYVIQLIGVASREWDKIVMIQALSATSTGMVIPVTNFTPLKIFIFFSAEGEYILEFCCLFGGWMTIFVYPGLAVLRCFRVFRLLWFYEVDVFKSTVIEGLSPLLGAKFVSRLFKVLKFAIKALSALGNEMFRLTHATRGGLLLMMVFFYSAFVLGTSLWIETDGENEACTSFQSCSYTMMRLTFYDGTGFDFAYSLTEKHRFLFFLVIVYMCLTSFGILNGLVGIFGTAFAVASDDAFNDSDDEGEDNEGDDGDGDEDGQQDGGEDDAEEAGSSGKSGRGHGSSWAKYGRTSREGRDDLDGALGTDLYRAVEEYDTNDENDKVGFSMLQRGMSRRKLEAKQLENQLRGKLGGKSNFAMKELARMAEAEGQAQRTAQQPRRTLRDIIRENNNDSLKAAAAAGEAVAVAGATAGAGLGMGAVRTFPAELAFFPRNSQEKDKLQKPAALPFAAKKVNKNLHAAVGMFSTLKSQKSGKNLVPSSSASAGAGHSHHASSAGANPFKQYKATMKLAAAAAAAVAGVGDGVPLAAVTAAEFQAMSETIRTLQRTVDAQNVVMQSLFQQVHALNHGLRVLHPDLPAAPTPMAIPVSPVVNPQPSQSDAATADSPVSAGSALPRRTLMSFSMVHPIHEPPQSQAQSHTHAAVASALSTQAPIPSTAAPSTADHSDNTIALHGVKSFLSNLNFSIPGHGSSSNSNTNQDNEQPANRALSAVHENTSIERRTSAERRPMLASFLQGKHPAPKPPDTPLSPGDGTAAAIDDQDLVIPGTRAVELSTLVAVRPAPAVSAVSTDVGIVKAEDAHQSAVRFSGVPESALYAGSTSDVLPSRPHGLDAQGSVDSFASLELSDLKDDSSSGPVQQQHRSNSAVSALSVASSGLSVAAGGAGSPNRPASQSKPRKSPVHHPRHSNQQSSILGAMGRISTPKVSIFDDAPGDCTRDNSPVPVQVAMSCHAQQLRPVSTTLAAKPALDLAGQQLQARPQTRKPTVEAGAASGHSLDELGLSEGDKRGAGLDEAEEGVRTIDPEDDLSTLAV